MCDQQARARLSAAEAEIAGAAQAHAREIMKLIEAAEEERRQWEAQRRKEQEEEAARRAALEACWPCLV